ncbi:MAG: hypothetical protein BWZ10_02891 [candidate division BRC1 bacterium ADurb.BinA364]|mgnify:CR=1 FL=1|nr:MAG: hypothetical protein BWZ10_02891 [candidate division BRC1 bacterium ADurb.BinA364]
MARTKFWSAAAVGLAITALLALAAPTRAEEGPLYRHSAAAKSTRKLARGVGNLLFGWAEIPKHMFREAYSVDPATGIASGFYIGLKRGGKRMLVGAWETLTFPAPCRRDYRPYIEPEFVLMDERD